MGYEGLELRSYFWCVRDRGRMRPMEHSMTTGWQVVTSASFMVCAAEHESVLELESPVSMSAVNRHPCDGSTA